MTCDLCKHHELHPKNDLLCDSCSEMIQRLVVVQGRMDSESPRTPAAAAAASAGTSSWAPQW
jgi:hypothetical protein